MCAEVSAEYYTRVRFRSASIHHRRRDWGSIVNLLYFYRTLLDDLQHFIGGHARHLEFLLDLGWLGEQNPQCRL